MTSKKLNEAYYQPNHFWTGGKTIYGLYKIKSIPKKDVKPWLAKQALLQVLISPPKEINHPITMRQNLMSNINLICLMCLIMSLKGTHSSTY